MNIRILIQLKGDDMKIIYLTQSPRKVPFAPNHIYRLFSYRPQTKILCVIS